MFLVQRFPKRLIVLHINNYFVVPYLFFYFRGFVRCRQKTVFVYGIHNFKSQTSNKLLIYFRNNSTNLDSKKSLFWKFFICFLKLMSFSLILELVTLNLFQNRILRFLRVLVHLWGRLEVGRGLPLRKVSACFPGQFHEQIQF
jgi:hypothetical protein